ncbi:dipeptidase [Rathayibacter iranicus]|uniref:Dipeptidase n=2 Tax=Rathayibacter iranicus TaxID=59737 RepID=A0AAD2JG11_9MICO|nr:dipeptidase [Rathayibacter iranicus]AZZ54872.1 dipeptidase [Rathayibacter iranicus]MWV31447.1 M20/M25/M40 family metallo-hydrolase [Rathayibacter iranicus NCPPB 2253 = VKM Ac-1602]PPI50282.1 dipeptidase [Rathayibacter iranicus]PPI62495.1 dipeptidase [Rathayibacter iranicus]PPI73554.1 dipeptidase [Rathayibacter iranicus]
MAHDALTPSVLSLAEEAVLTAVQDDLPRSLAQLGQLVRIPSVSWDGFDATRVAASAEAIAELARETGVFDEVSIRSSEIGDSGVLGQPAVLATRAARNGAPTVLLYAHHDVQPQGAEEAWETPPFEPTVRGNRLFGRGAADDKAGVVSHLAAVRALREVAGDDHDLGLVLFIEGEEEFGSRSFSTFLREHHDALRADAIIVADSDNWDVDTPALTVGLRGTVTLTLTISTLDHASHSGMLGGAVPDAMLAAVRLLSTLWTEDGSVAVAGLTEHDGAVPETTEADLRRDSGLLDGVSPIGTGPILSRTWSKPAITVTGIDAPSVLDASNTLTPSVRVKISARVAPGQEAAEAFAAIERHLRANAPFGAHLSLDDVDTGNPFLVDASGWAVDLVKGAMADAWGREPLETGIGGSIPFIADLVREFPEAQILVTGVEDPDSRAHSPNESLHLGVFKRAAQTEALFLLRAVAHRG